MVLLGLLGATAGVLLGLSRPVSYTSSATVLVNPVPGAPFSPETRGDQAHLETEQQLVTTPVIAELAADRLGDDADPDRLSQGVSAVVPSSTQLLEISFEADSADLAQRGAQAYAEAFLDFRAEQAEDAAQRELVGINNQRSTITGRLSDVTARLAEETDVDRRAFLNQRIDLLLEQLAALDSRRVQLASTDVDPGRIIDDADELPTSATLLPVPLPVAFGLGGAVLGLLVGLLVALLRQRADDRVHDGGALSAAGIRVLAELPAPGRRSAEPVVLTEPDSPAGEAYRRLRSAVVTAEVGQSSTVVLAGASADRSVATTATNLAIAIARVGDTVTLVDGEPKRNDLVSMLHVQDYPGLSDVLLHGRDVSSAVQPTRFRSLSVLPGGLDRAAAAERFLSDDMRRALETLPRQSQHVLVAASSIASADGEALARLADGVVLIVDRGYTTYAEVTTAVEELDRLGVPLIGAVLAMRSQRKIGHWQRTKRRGAEASSGSLSRPTTDQQDDVRVILPR